MRIELPRCVWRAIRSACCPKSKLLNVTRNRRIPFCTMRMQRFDQLSYCKMISRSKPFGGDPFHSRVQGVFAQCSETSHGMPAESIHVYYRVNSPVETQTLGGRQFRKYPPSSTKNHSVIDEIGPEVEFLPFLSDEDSLTGVDVTHNAVENERACKVRLVENSS